MFERFIYIINEQFLFLLSISDSWSISKILAAEAITSFFCEALLSFWASLVFSCARNSELLMEHPSKSLGSSYVLLLIMSFNVIIFRRIFLYSSLNEAEAYI